MKPLIIKALGPLASLAYQERHIVHWSGDECRLPRELADAALLEIGNDLDNEAALEGLSSHERDALAHGFEVLCLQAAALSFDSVDADELVHKNEHWLIMRYTAIELLAALGSTVEDWERNNIPGSVPPAALGTMLPRERFCPDRLLVATESDRERILSELASILTTRLRAARDFDETTAEITAELWGLGHDLRRLETTSERELWAPEGAVWPKAPGIAVELHRSGIATVRWAPSRREQSN